MSRKYVWLVIAAFIIVMGAYFLCIPVVRYDKQFSREFEENGLESYSLLVNLLMRDYEQVSVEGSTVRYRVDYEQGRAVSITRFGEYEDATALIADQEMILQSLTSVYGVLFQNSSVHEIYVDSERVTFSEIAGTAVIIYMNSLAIPNYYLYEGDVGSFTLYKLTTHWYYSFND